MQQSNGVWIISPEEMRGYQRLRKWVWGLAWIAAMLLGLLAVTSYHFLCVLGWM